MKLPDSAPLSIVANTCRLEFAGETLGLYRPDIDRIRVFHMSMPGYDPTPLVALPGLAAELGLAELWVKDESHRFGLKAFKGLGASYAIFEHLALRILERSGRAVAPDFEALRLEVSQQSVPELCTATDGNHGRAVAWMARLLDLPAHIYMPAGSAAARIEAIRAEGAEVSLVDGGYDRAVATARDDAASHGWQVISDTSYDGYAEIPSHVMAGYLTMFAEIDEQLPEDHAGFTDLIVQTGVGSITAAAGFYCRSSRRHERVRLISVEPREAACLFESVLAGSDEAVTATGNGRTIMAGLNCGTLSPMAWPVIRSTYDFCAIVDDDLACRAMRRLARPTGGDPAIIAGESGAAGLAALLEMARTSTRPIGASSRVLLLNTEGDTDPTGYQAVVGRAR